MQTTETQPQMMMTQPQMMMTQPKKIKIFRFKLCDEIMTIITQFSKIHQYDDRHTYKEAWHLWLINQRETVDNEIARLKQLGYTGDVEDKMFKAGRYYFREKVEDAGASAGASACTDADIKKRRDYVVMSADVIQAMDRHLAGMITNNNFSPANGFTNFCEQHIELLRTEITRLIQVNKTFTSDVLSTKIKKTYKNRYFKLKN